MTSSPRPHVWFTGFLVLGILLGSIGPMLVAWQYHLDADPREIGLHFLALNAGYVAAAAFCQRLLRRRSIRSVVIAASGVAAAGLVGLTFAAPPEPVGWRLVGLAVLGLAGGALATALFHCLEPTSKEGAGKLAIQASAWFSSGCLLAAVIIGGAYSTGRDVLETILLAVVPLVFLAVFVREPVPVPLPIRPARDVRSLRMVATVLFSLLLFFQFGNEWALAGWLPLFLIRRLGSNPVAAIFALAVYFLFLVVGRGLARALIGVVSHRKLLLASIILAMGGYLLLAATTTFSGAYTAIVVIGLGFGPIYPLIVENLDSRFAYHPGFYNGIFSIAVTGAMCAPWLLGYLCQFFGIQYVVLVPAIGSVFVCILALLLMLEAHLMREETPSDHSALLY
ncbi:MAG TPA: MFS transporter [Bryobacteraceae bacterium]|nr:MFS transporter [Bryobacteraceae bacterium]